MKNYDVVIVGGGAGGLFAAYEFTKVNPDMKVCILEKGNRLEKRKCPIDGVKIKNCIHCQDCSIMTGIGGAGAFSDGKYNITNNFGGDIASYIGPEKSLELMNYVDSINMIMGGEGAKRYTTVHSDLKREALKHDLHLLDAEVRHLGTDRNYVILSNIVKRIENNVDIFCNTAAVDIMPITNKTQNDSDEVRWVVVTDLEQYAANNVIVCTGRSGSAWTNKICEKLGIECTSNRVDIGVRFECPAEIWDPITSQVYESKILYRSPTTGCVCRTFCMNERGHVVLERTNDLLTVNGHSFSESDSRRSNNTNFALLVTHNFTEPFKDSNAYGEAVVGLTNMLSGGVMVQRFGDLIANRRTTDKRLGQSFVQPTLKAATPGNIALAMPKATLDTIIDMIYALDKICPGTAGLDNLLYATEVKYATSIVDVDNNFESKCKGLFFCGDCSGTSRSLSVASSEGVYIARYLMSQNEICVNLHFKS